MIIKKLFFLLLVFIGTNVVAAHSYADNAIATAKKGLADQEKGIRKILIKLTKKEPLTEQEEEFLLACRNYSIGTLGGLTCFYLIPPVGFGVISALIVKGLFAVAGGFGLVELFKIFTVDEIKEKLQELFANKQELIEKLEG